MTDSFRLVENRWYTEFEVAAGALRHELRIVTPFLQLDAVQKLVTKKLHALLVITRFNLDDFQKGVSSLEALRWLLAKGAKIGGIQHLHAKAYIFDDSRSIVTSANLTNAALVRNHELGFVATDLPLVAECRSYFDQLWKKARRLDKDLLKKIQARLQPARHGSHGPLSSFKGGDYGAKIGLPAPPVAQKRVPPNRTTPTPGRTHKTSTRSVPQKKKASSKSGRVPRGPFQPDVLLAEIVGSKPLLRTELVKKLWSYIKRNKLRDKATKTMINADDALKAVINGRRRVSLRQIGELAARHVRSRRESAS